MSIHIQELSFAPQETQNYFDFYHPTVGSRNIKKILYGCDKLLGYIGSVSSKWNATACHQKSYFKSTLKNLAPLNAFDLVDAGKTVSKLPKKYQKIATKESSLAVAKEALIRDVPSLTFDVSGAFFHVNSALGKHSNLSGHMNNALTYSFFVNSSRQIHAGLTRIESDFQKRVIQILNVGQHACSLFGTIAKIATKFFIDTSPLIAMVTTAVYEGQMTFAIMKNTYQEYAETESLALDYFF